MTVQCRHQLVYNGRKKLQPGLEIAMLVTLLRFCKFPMYLNVH